MRATPRPCGRAWHRGAGAGRNACRLSVVEVFGQRVTRVILVEPGAADGELVAEMLARRTAGLRMVVEDCFGGLEFPGRDGVVESRLPLMVRAAGPVADARSGADVGVVRDEDGLATVERVIVDGFPRPSMQPYQRGKMWRGWLVCASVLYLCRRDRVYLDRIWDAGVVRETE